MGSEMCIRDRSLHEHASDNSPFFKVRCRDRYKSAPRKNTHMELKHFMVFSMIYFNQKSTYFTYQSFFDRSHESRESHDRPSIANGCSRDVVLSHVSAIQKKRRELSILIDTKLPQAPMPRYSNPVSKNERLEFFPKKCSFLHVSSLTSSSMKKKEDMQ